MNSRQMSSSDTEINRALPDPGVVELQPKFLAAIDMLRKAWLYAQDTERDLWDFAIEATTLEQSGLARTDFRWLACKEFVLHGCELSQPGSETRSFRKSAGLTFEARTCFVLTQRGFEFANSILEPTPSLCNIHATRLSAPSQLPTNHQEHQQLDDRPQWNCDSRELHFMGRLVKQFKVPSPNQEIVIMSFQEESWPTCIDDPLPACGDRDPKQRLHDTIRSLNRNQKNRMLRFKGNGTGQAIIWEAVKDACNRE